MIYFRLKFTAEGGKKRDVWAQWESINRNLVTWRRVQRDGTPTDEYIVTLRDDYESTVARMDLHYGELVEEKTDERAE